MKIEQIIDAQPDGGEGLLGIIVYDLNQSILPDGVHFITDSDMPIQAGIVQQSEGHKVPAHFHPGSIVSHRVRGTPETLFILDGQMRVDFYTATGMLISYLSRIVKTGDLIILLGGGHGFEMLKPTRLLEVRQGPYVAKRDKIRFAV